MCLYCVLGLRSLLPCCRAGTQVPARRQMPFMRLPVVAYLLCVGLTDGSATPPNIAIIHADDLGYVSSCQAHPLSSLCP